MEPEGEKLDDHEMKMKVLSVEEYIKRTAGPKETSLLHEELENFVRAGPGRHVQRFCDRVIRACHHQLGVGPPDSDHVTRLIQLVEFALSGYDLSGEFEAQSSPLYMEKIIYHILRKLSSLGVHRPFSHLGTLLYQRIAPAPQTGDFRVVVQNCFTVLWNGLSGVQDNTPLNPRDKLRCQMQSLGFLLLLDRGSPLPLSSSKVPMYTNRALAQYEKSCGTLTEEDASFLLQETHSHLLAHWTGGQGGEGDRDLSEQPCLSTLCEVVLMNSKLLCKAGCWGLASGLMDGVMGRVKECTKYYWLRHALVLGRQAVDVHRSLSSGEDCRLAFTDCAWDLRSLPAALEDPVAHAVLEGCEMVVWAVEAGESKGLSGAGLLALFSFLREYHPLLVQKRSQKDLKGFWPESQIQKMLCFSMSRVFVFADESLFASKLEKRETLDRVLLYCNATAGRMMTEVRKLPSDDMLVQAVTTVNRLACALYNRRLYDQAFTLLEILCQDLRKNCPASLSNELSWAFRWAVQSSHWSGQLERALDWVILWLQALGDRVTGHMTEPVSLWVKIKVDAVQAGQEDTRLRTLRDGFGCNVPDEGVMLCLLEEELRVYKEVSGDTTEERYNTLCDLLDICHESSSHTHLRAVYLCEMAQVVCFQDFSEQTDCSAVDFTQEALRLLEEEQETSKNADRLKDDKAHASLWLYICTLEKTLQEAIETEKKLQDVSERAGGDAVPVSSNDLDYEDKQKQQDSHLVYEGLGFDLAAESKRSQPLDRALREWSSLLQKRKDLPSVRNPKQTCSSIALTAALYKLMGKPLQALESYQLAIGLSRCLGDAQGCATSLCHSARLLLDLGAPGPAQSQLEEAEQCLASDSVSSTTEGPSTLSMTAKLLRAQLCYSTGQVELGVPYLCEVLNELGREQRYSKSWYLHRARTLQTSSAYLSLDTGTLSQDLRQQITQHGLKTADTALTESLEWLASLLAALVGKGLYGANCNIETRFINQGENLLLKWLVMSELLSCSLKIVAVRSSTGAVHEARHLCLEALKLATKLQTLSQYAELLVLKAELELMKGERVESALDLDRVFNLLELCMDFSNQEKKVEVKIKPRKGRPSRKPEPPLPSPAEDSKSFLTTRWLPKEPVERKDPASSPPLKARPQRWPSSLDHRPDCQCPCCSEPSLGRVTVRWAAAQADLALQLGPAEARASRKLHLATLARCKSITAKLAVRLARLFPGVVSGPANRFPKPALLQDVVGSVYLRMALAGLELQLDKGHGPWKILEAGLAFVTAKPSPDLGPLRAGLLAVKALAACLALAAQRDCSPEELFSAAWTWNAPKGDVETHHIKAKPLPLPASARKTRKEDPAAIAAAKPKDAKTPRVPKNKVTFSLSSIKASGKCLAPPMTPVMVKPSQARSGGRELSSFDFSTEVPTVACTPVQRARAPRGGGGGAKAAPKLAFQVYEEASPSQEKPQPVPAAPKKTNKSRFKVQFSDESDAEADPQEKGLKEKKPAASKKPTAYTRTTRVRKQPAAPEPPAEKKSLPKRQGRRKVSTAVPHSTSSEEEVVEVVPAPARRGGRPRRQQAAGREAAAAAAGAGGPDTGEEPERLRTIDEDMEGIMMDSSIEELRASDTETEESAASSMAVDGPGTGFEVLRRDLCGDGERDCLSELRSGGPLHSNAVPDGLSLEVVQSLLRSAWLALQHFPPPSLYPSLCTLLALLLGQQDPVTTAMLHAQSVGVTTQHDMIRHLSNRLRKLKENASELTDKLGSLSLDDPPARTGTVPLEQRLAQLENIFAFPTADPSAFPQHHCQQFIQQINNLPKGVTVCLLSVARVQPGEIGDTLLLTRLERGSSPVTVCIHTAQRQHPLSWLLQEFDSIQKQQKVVWSESEKTQWWAGRWALDSRVKKLCEKMEALLGCWRGLLLPLTSDPKLITQAKHLHKTFTAWGVQTSEEMLKALLSASPLLSLGDVRWFAQGLCPERAEECVALLRAAVSALRERAEPQGHVVLILDKYLQKLPWETISCLSSRAVTRMPSLSSLLGHCALRTSDPECVLNRGVDPKQVFYVLNPDANLPGTEERLKDLFCSNGYAWQGVSGAAPDTDHLQEAVTTKDLYIYVGHGAGARFLDRQKILQEEMRAACMLFGCSSAALAVHGELEGSGIILDYLMAGCPLVLGNLWDVTDRDIDRFTTALLQSWMSAGPGAALLDHMDSSRQATQLKYIIGAAPVVYGLPVHLR